MSDFIIYPAIDLRDGKVVRLSQGMGDKQTIYGNSPAITASEWIDQGAEWLHIVNLNGAFGENTNNNELAIEEIAAVSSSNAKIQLGGGLRTIDQIEAALALGISRVVLGTSVIEDPEFGVAALNKFGGDRIAFGFDALGNELMSRGWKKASGLTMAVLAEKLASGGAKTLIYTNIEKDGMQTGVDWKNTMRLAVQTGMDVIASGGTATLDDIKQVRKAGLAGVIIGRALYEGNFTLEEALNVR